MSTLLNLTDNLELKTNKSKPQDIKERTSEFSAITNILTMKRGLQ